MSCTPLDLLTLAEQLATEASEVAHRSAMSRAYYAAYHDTRETFPELWSSPREKHESSHAFVIRRAAEFAKNKSNAGRKEAAVISARLEAARRERNLADYLISNTLSLYSAEETLKKARLILSLCEKVRELQIGNSP